MELTVLQALVESIRTNGRLPGVHDFNIWVRENLGGSTGRQALTSLLDSECVRILSAGYYPTINALWSAPAAFFRPEITTARRLLPILKGHFKAQQGQPLKLAGLAVPVEPGAMPLPFLILLCHGAPVAAGDVDQTGGATTVTTSEAVLDLDEDVWPLLRQHADRVDPVKKARAKTAASRPAGNTKLELRTGDGTTEEVLLTWLHLSDLHFGHGDAEHHFDQAVVLRELSKDVRLAKSRGVPNSELIVVTGDIAYSGGADKNTGVANQQYDDARAWIEQLRSDTNVPPDGVLVVPGNHDVIRPRARKGNLLRLLKYLRDGTPVDEALRDTDDRELLLRYQELFWSFAGLYNGEGLYWQTSITLTGDQRTRFVGLNTALLALDETDRGKLQLGMAQVDFLTRGAREGDITVILTHHPVAEEWLADRQKVQPFFAKKPTIHLHGHTHLAGTSVVTHGAGTGLIKVVAGAAHSEKREPQSHGYNFASLIRTSTAIILRVWPRRWSPANADFRVDVDGVPDGKTHADHLLVTLSGNRPPRRRREGGGHPSRAARQSGDAAVSRPAKEGPSSRGVPEPGPHPAQRARTPPTDRPPAPDSASSRSALRADLLIILAARTESQLEALAFELRIDRAHLPGMGRSRTQLALALVDLAPSIDVLAAAIAAKGWF